MQLSKKVEKPKITPAEKKELQTLRDLDELKRLRAEREKEKIVIAKVYEDRDEKAKREAREKIKRDLPDFPEL